MIREYYPSFFFFFLRRQIRKCVLKPTDYYYFRDFKERTAFIVSFFVVKIIHSVCTNESCSKCIQRVPNPQLEIILRCAQLQLSIKFDLFVQCFFCASFLFYWDGTSRRTFFPDARFDLRSSVVLSLFSWIKSRQS